MEEALSGIRTVFAFAGEKEEVTRYTKLLDPARRAAIRKGLFASISDSVTRFLFFASSALSFWIGVQWVLNDRDKVHKEYTPATLLIVSELIEQIVKTDKLIDMAEISCFCVNRRAIVLNNGHLIYYFTVQL